MLFLEPILWWWVRPGPSIFSILLVSLCSFVFSPISVKLCDAVLVEIGILSETFDFSEDSSDSLPELYEVPMGEFFQSSSFPSPNL